MLPRCCRSRKGKSIVKSHWITDMVDFYHGLDIFMAERPRRPAVALDSLLEPTGPLQEAQELAAAAFGSPPDPASITNGGTSAAEQDRHPVLVAPVTSCCWIATATSRITTGMMLGGANVIYLDAYQVLKR